MTHNVWKKTMSTLCPLLIVDAPLTLSVYHISPFCWTLRTAVIALLVQKDKRGWKCRVRGKIHLGLSSIACLSTLSSHDFKLRISFGAVLGYLWRSVPPTFIWKTSLIIIHTIWSSRVFCTFLWSWPPFFCIEKCGSCIVYAIKFYFTDSWKW